jgi:hypothetical protein
MGVVMRRNNERETAVKGHDGDGWSSDGMVLWVGRKQNGDIVKWLREWSKLR